MYKVVIADDEYMVKVGLKALIESETEQFSVVGEAEDGEQALDIIYKEKPDLLITDIKMPVMDGLALIKEVRRKQLPIETVIISGYGEFLYAQEAIRNGAADYLLKPIDPDSMMQALNRLRDKWEKRTFFSAAGTAGSPVFAADPVRKTEISVESLTEPGHWGYAQIVSEAISYIETHFSDPCFSLKDVASHFHLSPAYFSYIFKKVKRIPFIQFLTRMRMERAKCLLADPSNKIYMVGQAVGYPDYIHFTKTFKKYTGHTPSEYRKYIGLSHMNDL